MTIRFLGTSSCRFDAGDDTVHYLVDDSILVDTGWFVSAHLRSLGVGPGSLRGVVFTHLHHDHYLGLPGLIFSLYSDPAAPRPTIYGPQADVRSVVSRAEELLQKSRFFAESVTPPVVELPERGEFVLGDVTVRYMSALHPVDARSYLFIGADGKRLGITGDTAYNPAGAEFFAGCDLLVHEASFGPREVTASNNRALHSSAMDAARVARDAGVGQLILVHGAAADRSASIDAASSIYKGAISWPEPGQKTTLS
jgi:ribonuclease Z